MYADDSTLYTPATTASEITVTLNEELQLISDWVVKEEISPKYFKNKKQCIVEVTKLIGF